MSFETIRASICDRNIPIEETVGTIGSQCNTAVQSAVDGQPALDDLSHSRDTPGLEGFLWRLWAEVLSAAEQDRNLHGRLKDVLKGLKAGTGTRQPQNWTVWGESTNWSSLPIFGAEARESINGPSAQDLETNKVLDIRSPTAQAILSGSPATSSDAIAVAWSETRSQWLNLHAFLALLWSESVYPFPMYALWSMRAALEDPVDPHPWPYELSVEEAAIWVQIVGRKMFECKDIFGPRGNGKWEEKRGKPGRGGRKWDGVDGYDLERWNLWKEEFRKIAKKIAIGESAVRAAKDAVETMEQIEVECA